MTWAENRRIRYIQGYVMQELYLAFRQQARRHGVTVNDAVAEAVEKWVQWKAAQEVATIRADEPAQPTA